MDIRDIELRLQRVKRVVDGWSESGKLPPIERDIALAELRELYVAILDATEDTPVEGVAPAVVVAAPIVEESVEAALVKSDEEPAERVVEAEEPVVEEVEDDLFDDALDIDALLGLSGDDPVIAAPAPMPVVEAAPEVEPIPAPEVEPAPEPEVEPAPEPEVEPIPEPEVESAPEPAPHIVSGGLFDIEDIPVRTRTSRKMISLYNATPMPTKDERVVAESGRESKSEVECAPAKPRKEVVVEIEPEEESLHVTESVAPVADVVGREEPRRLADVLGGNVTLGDKMAAEEQPTTPFNRITDLRKAIGINDKFQMVRDLFGGDVKKYDETIELLNGFDDLDECMIYIVENFRWNPDSEGAKLLVSLIERKLA